MTVEQDKAASDAKRIEEMNKLPSEDRTTVIATSSSLSEKTIAPGISALKALNQDLDPVTVNKKAALDEALRKDGIVGNSEQLIAQYGTPEAAMKAIKDSPKTRGELKTGGAVVSADATDSAGRDGDNAELSAQKSKDKKEEDENINASNVAATAVIANEIASGSAANGLAGYAGNNPPLGNLKSADVSPTATLGEAGGSMVKEILRSSPALKADVLES